MLIDVRSGLGVSSVLVESLVCTIRELMDSVDSGTMFVVFPISDDFSGLVMSYKVSCLEASARVVSTCGVVPAHAGTVGVYPASTAAVGVVGSAECLLVLEIGGIPIILDVTIVVSVHDVLF